jgi:hypothetical protein
MTVTGSKNDGRSVNYPPLNKAKSLKTDNTLKK